MARTPADFLVAARQVPAPLNASAISGEYLSAASFLGVAGLAMLEGLGALWYAVGYAAGYLVLLAAVAAPLRRFGAYTIPDFAEGRLGSPALRRAATATVILICGFYLLPQLKGAGVTLQVAVGGPVWIGVVVLGAIVTPRHRQRRHEGHHLRAGLPVLAQDRRHRRPRARPPGRRPAPAGGDGDRRGATDLRTQDRGAVSAGGGDHRDRAAVEVAAAGIVDGVDAPRAARAHQGPSQHRVGRHAHAFPPGRPAPHVESNPVMSGAAWTSPLLQLGGRPDHALAATYGVLLATVLGAMGLPHILVRFYTNRDGQAARRTTAFVLLLLGCFYVFPAVFAVLGRLEAPGLYTSGQTDSVVLVLPRIMAAGTLGVVLGALVAAGAFAAFLSTSSGLLISMSGALSHDIMGGGVRAFRFSAIAIGIVMTALGLAVLNISINVLVGWAFAIAASTFCPLLLLGIWWRRFTWIGAIGGLILGGLASSIAVLLTIVGVGSSGWPAVLLSEPAIWTVPLAFLTMIVLSLATPRAIPGDVTQQLLALHLPERVRLPSVADRGLVAQAGPVGS